MIVMKFGGSSLANAECLKRVAELACSHRERGVLVVLSAAGKSTDQLFAMAQQAEAGDVDGALESHCRFIQIHQGTATELFSGVLPSELDLAICDLSDELCCLLRGVAMLRELSPRSMDAIASIGERLSTRLLAAYLGVPWVDARTIMRTDAAFGSARPDVEAIQAQASKRMASLVQPGSLAVTQGYIGATAEGLTTTLGRGGSDFSASLFGAALGAQEIQIWTDVEGVLTCDPRIVPQAQPIPELSFAEAAELAAFGAKVLHPATIEPAVEAGIPVTVRDTCRPEGRFTTITADPRTGRPITALASRSPISILTVSSASMLQQSGFLARIFDVFRRCDASVDLVATAEVSVSLTVEADAPLKALVEELSSFATVEVAEGRALLALVGEQLKATPGITGRVFSALQDINVEMISMGANEINLSLAVRQEDADPALRLLHEALFEEVQP